MINEKTLLLDKNYIALSVIPWKKVVKLIVNGKVEAVCNSNVYTKVLSMKGHFSVPSVVRLLVDIPWRAHEANVRFSRKNIILRDNNECFTGDTMVLLYNGDFKQISNIQAGESIIDAYGDKQVVEFVNKKKIDKEILKIRKRGNGDHIYVTPEHPILVYNVDSKIFRWKSAAKITINDYLCEPKIILNETNTKNGFDLYKYCDLKYLNKYGLQIKHYCGNLTNRFIQWHNDLGKLVGYFLSEGNSYGNVISFAFHIKEDEYAEDVRTLVKNIFGIGCRIINIENRHTKIVKCNSSIMAEFFNKLCLGTGEKRLQNKSCSIGFLKGILYGICRGDATFNEELSRCTLMLCNENLVRDIFIISNICGIYPTLSKTGHRKDGRIYKSVVYNAEQFNAISRIAMIDKGQYKSNFKKSDRLFDDRYIFAKVVSIDHVFHNGFVYNLQISGSHTYVVNNTAVHNCQYCGTKVGKNATIDHVIPKSRSGKTDYLNCVASCHACNNKKADRTPNEASMKLMKKPRNPSFYTTYKTILNNAPAEWKIYILGLDE